MIDNGTSAIPGGERLRGHQPPSIGRVVV